MLEQQSIKTQHFGQDGFYWFVGQVVIDENWRVQKEKQSNKYGYRAKVRILGKHPHTAEIPDDKLPWAHFLVPPTMGAGINHYGISNVVQGGETVFGFFLDGEDAQQPVIFGALYQHEMIENIQDWNDVLEKGTSGFAPITTDPILKPGAPTRAVGDGVIFEGGTIPDNNNYIQAEGGGGNTINTVAQYKNNELIEVISATECNLPALEMSNATKELQKVMGYISTLKNVQGSYVDPVLNTIVNVDKVIARAASKMAGGISGVISRARDDMFEKIDDALSKKLSFLDPDFIAKQLEADKQKDGISCLFSNILKGLASMIGKFLKSLIGKVLNLPICAAEQFLSGLLAKLSGDILSGIGPALGALGSLMGGGIADFSSILGKAFAGAQALLGLLSCEGAKCATPTDFIINKGPSSKKALDFDRMIGMQSIMSKVDSGIDNLIEEAFPNLGKIGSTVSEISTLAGTSASIPNIAGGESLKSLAGGCNTHVKECGPPKVEIFGGGGIGAAAKAVINETGKIVGVKMDDLGLGYKDIPYVTFIDNCGNGKGASATAIVENEQVVEIVMITEGEGYLGGGGNTGEGSAEGEQVIGEISKVQVLSTGVNYQQGDLIIVEGSTPLTPIIEDGRIVGAEGISSVGLDRIPTLTIQSNTGYGAIIRPVTTFKPIEDYEQTILPSSQILHVVDCPRGY